MHQGQGWEKLPLGRVTVLLRSNWHLNGDGISSWVRHMLRVTLYSFRLDGLAYLHVQDRQDSAPLISSLTALPLALHLSFIKRC